MSEALRAAKISFKDQIAGFLEETAAGGTRFIYHESWRESIDALTRRLLTAFGERIGLPNAVIDRAFRNLKSKARQAVKVLPNPDEGRDEFGARFAEIVRNACLRLLEE
jgi:hypothetical protein